MPLHPTWADILLRLLLTLAAGALMGFNRGSRGHAAGLRTTILVTLAASISMIQANVLLTLDGKTPGSFAVMDLMRLPLGILTGVGFIGGGAILKKGDSIKGVTTAATLWLATVIGLCFGGGQLALGTIGTATGILTLWAMQWIDVRIRRDHHAVLIVATAPGVPTPPVDDLLRPLGYRARLRKQNRAAASRSEEEVETSFNVTWKQAEHAVPSVDFLDALTSVCRIKSVEIVSEGDH